MLPLSRVCSSKEKSLWALPSWSACSCLPSIDPSLAWFLSCFLSLGKAQAEIQCKTPYFTLKYGTHQWFRAVAAVGASAWLFQFKRVQLFDFLFRKCVTRNNNGWVSTSLGSWSWRCCLRFGIRSFSKTLCSLFNAIKSQIKHWIQGYQDCHTEHQDHD